MLEDVLDRLLGFLQTLVQPLNLAGLRLDKGFLDLFLGVILMI